MTERALARLYDVAEPRGGYFTTRLAAGVGVSTRLLTHYTNGGDIERVAHGVYRLTRFPAHRFGDAIAATLWAGDDSVVSHDSALAVYGIGAAMPAAIHLSLPRPFRGRREGVVVHRAPLQQAERRVWDGVPVTTVERSLRDVALDVDPALAAEAAADAVRHGLTTPARLASYLRERPDVSSLETLLLGEAAPSR